MAIEEGFGDYDPLSCCALSMSIFGETIPPPPDQRLIVRCILDERKFSCDFGQTIDVEWDQIASLKTSIHPDHACCEIVLIGSPSDASADVSSRTYSFRFDLATFGRFVDDMILSSDELAYLIEHGSLAAHDVEAVADVTQDNIHAHALAHDVEPVADVTQDNAHALAHDVEVVADITQNNIHAHVYNLEEFDDYTSSLHYLFDCEENFGSLPLHVEGTARIGDLPKVPNEFNEDDLDGLF